jgi:hypothetical protein
MVYDREFFSALSCPTSVTWTNDIAKLFTSTDVEHMKQVTGGSLDLSSYASVKIWATKIYSEVASGAMPPAGSGEQPWTQDMINTFGCWIQQGTPQ